MLDLLQRFQELPGLYSVTAAEKCSGNYVGEEDALGFGEVLPCFDIKLSIQQVGAGPSIWLIEQANQIMRAWADECNATCDRAMQELKETWIEPTVIDKQVWAYPDLQAVMPVPVELRGWQQWEIAQPFSVQAFEVEGFETGCHERSVTTYTLAAMMVLQPLTARQWI